MDNLYEIYLEQAKLMHQDPKVWKGHMIKRYMPQIKEIIEEHKKGDFSKMLMYCNTSLGLIEPLIIESKKSDELSFLLNGSEPVGFRINGSI